ncbi:MAG: hypothetical protein C5B51_13650 [Terriglobia bacterium]|nr:MAG: hypothetical protein C5B51_13650 [Terriglobia bacterium]
MSAFLKIDTCSICHRSLPWEWVPAVLLNGKAMAGTGVWCSQLATGICPACVAAAETKRQEEKQDAERRRELIELLGGQKPYRDFTFELYQVTQGNRLAYERCKQFDPASQNIYLWGPSGVGKTHLSYAAARRCFDETLSVAIVQAGQLSRQVRMQGPEQEQAAIDGFAEADVLMLDDLGLGAHTAYSRQLLREILDARDCADRAGLIVTSPYSLDDLAATLNDDAIASRLAGLCRVTEIRGPDFRLTIRKEAP